MQAEFITRVTIELLHQGYLSGNPACVPGVQSLFYAHSPRRFQLGFAKVEDHFLFVDWGNTALGRLDRLLEIAAGFSRFVNQRFPMPHALRLQIPNLVVAGVSPEPFPQHAVQFARAKNLTPWYGGETGQIILIALNDRQVISQITTSPRRYPIPGALPLGHAASVIRAACQASFI